MRFGAGEVERHGQGVQTGSGDPAAVAVQAGARLVEYLEVPENRDPTCRLDDLEVVAEVGWARRGYKSLMLQPLFVKNRSIGAALVCPRFETRGAASCKPSTATMTTRVFGLLQSLSPCRIGWCRRWTSGLRSLFPELHRHPA